MTRGFAESEFATRCACAQAEMARTGLGALLLTTEPEIRYYTGFLTRFWESPTRPWFLILPPEGKPVAVIPSIGAALMAQAYVGEIKTWRAPDLYDDGVSLLIETLNEVREGAPVGMARGLESHARMPVASLMTVQKHVPMTGDGHLTRRLRMVKSEGEIAKIEAACQIATRAFDRMAEIAREGTGLDQVFRDFQRLCLEEGADWVPYLAGAAAREGYGDVISPATDAPLQRGDVLMLDTGLVWDGYFCDFDRNFTIGPPSGAVADAHAQLVEATQAGFAAAKPGATGAELFHAMDRICTGGAGGSEAGRLGHGLGMQLTEWPSVIPDDSTVLEPGMVLTLEPGVQVLPGKIPGKLMVHEEDIVITETGARYLTRPSPPEIEVLA
ncbi:MAG: Xaa-Pro peptidase family protein [Pseudomonadota bacterium]